MVHARPISRQLRTHIRVLLQALSLIAAAVAMTSATVGCGRENSNAPNGTAIAVTALSNCATGATYQGDSWSRTPYGQVNATPYGYGVRNFQVNQQMIQNEGFCGCAAGTQPMCDAQAGVICLKTEMLGGADLALWQPGPRGLNFSGYAGYTAYGNVHDPRSHRRPVQRSYPPGYASASGVRYAQANQCASHIGQTCTVGTNSCDQGSFCHRLAPNRALGICSR